MERIVLSEHVEQELGEVPVQTSGNVGEKPKKKRSQSDKLGINRWNQQLLKRVLDRQEAILEQLRWVRVMLDRMGVAAYSQSDVEGFSAQDEIDKEIVQRLFEVGANGALPKDVAAEVNKRSGYKLRYYEVSRRLVRMNNRLYRETGKLLFEKRGHRWALTRVAFEAYGSASPKDLVVEAAH